MMTARTFTLPLFCATLAALCACSGTERRDMTTASGATETSRSTSKSVRPGPPPERREIEPSTQRAAPARTDEREKRPRAEPTGPPEPAGATDASQHREARVTPLDQSEAPEDLQVTRRIREAVVRDDSLSFRAKNITIVTTGDRVVLTGRVSTKAEADRIKAIAKAVTPYPIEDRLEVHD